MRTERNNHISTESRTTKGIETLLGDPKKAILKLSTPMILGMFFQAIYNIADGIWVAGLGADQLAAVGLFFPFFMVIISLGAGIGIGGGSAASRRIGKGDKSGADNTAIHTFLIGGGISLIISISILPFLDTIFSYFSGNGNVGAMAAGYAKILFSGTVIMVFSHIAGALLRSEGDARRAMYGLMIGSLLNIVLDPIFIYWLDMGVIGAAWATIISLTFSSLLFCYWLFFKKDTYLIITLKDFNFNRKILSEILKVGVPSSLAQLSMSFAMIILNKVVIRAGGTDGIAVFTSGWRIVMLGVIPLIGISTGVVSVTGAAYGAGDREKLKSAFYYAVKFGLLIEISIGILILIFARPVAHIFTYSEGSERILEDLVTFLRIICLIYPTVPMGMLTSAMFRGIGHGGRSLIVTIIRTIILQVPAAYFLGIILNMGLTGVWIGMVGGNILALIVTFSWGIYTVNKVPLPRSKDN